jgi:hypothetical protein
MKILHLVYNNFLKNYVLVEGKNSETGRKIEVGKLESDKLDEAIELKRKSILYVVGQVPEEDYKKLEGKYSGTKIKLERKL